MTRRLAALMLLLALAIPSVVSAEGPGDAGGFDLRVDGDYHVPAGTELGTLVVIEGNAVIDGTLTGSLVVIEGRATVSGEVRDSVIVVSGDLDLAATARVKDVTLIRSSLAQAPGATITGDLNRTSVVFSRGWAIVFSIIVWVGVTIFVLLAGALFAHSGGRQLGEIGTLMSSKPGPTILTGIASAILFPVVGVALLVTVIGIPAGLGVLLVAIPLVLLAGHIAAGTWLGSMILSRTSLSSRSRPVAPALLGLVILQTAVLVPGVGGAGVFLFSALWGGGAVVYRLWKGAPQPAIPADAAVAPATG